MKILDKLNIPDNKCPYCTFKQSKDWPWEFRGKLRGCFDKVALYDDEAYLEYDYEEQEDYPGVTLEIYLDGDMGSLHVSHCPWCGRKLS